MSPISLLPFEDTILRIIAEKLDLPYRSRYGYILYDSIRGVGIALSYAMELVDNKCIFLDKDNLCRIHSIYKPLVCRSYPYVPKQIRYTISRDLKIVFASVEYGISTKCPVIERDREYLSKLITHYVNWPQIYFREEYKAALEMEEKRSLLLRLLSKLWINGVVDLKETNPNKNIAVVNLYELLRSYYPNLPYMLGIDRVYKRLREI